jgi:hypothetical protein
VKNFGAIPALLAAKTWTAGEIDNPTDQQKTNKTHPHNGKC